MDAHEMCDADAAFELCQSLPAWINLYRSSDGLRRYRAKELDRSFNGLPTLAVEVSDATGRIAGYKTNAALIPAGETSWLVFSPLVVLWEKNKEERDRGLGRPIIDHSVSSISGFCRARARHIPNILVASGNLTVAKAGRPFFETLGWEIATPADLSLHGEHTGLGKAMRFIAAQISAAIAQLGPDFAEEASSFSFAMLALTQASNPRQLDTSFQNRASL
jgi:hypothetical protein